MHIHKQDARRTTRHTPEAQRSRATERPTLLHVIAGKALIPISVVVAVLLSEAITITMSLILHGEVLGDFILTGFVASMVVATIITIMIKVMRDHQNKIERENAIKDALIVELKRTEAELRVGAAAFESMEPKILLDAEGHVIKANQAFLALTGYSANDIMGSPPFFLTKPDSDHEYDLSSVGISDGSSGYWQEEVGLRKAMGARIKALLTLSGIKDSQGAKTHTVGSIHDLTKLVEASEEIRRLSRFDQLTGLPNLNSFRERLKTSLPGLRRDDQQAAFVVVDIDDFSIINQTAGPSAGDAVLMEAGARLHKRIRESDALARLSSDEFGLLLLGLGTTEREAAALARAIVMELLDVVSKPYRIGELTFQKSWCAGITLLNGQERDIEALFQQAQVALHASKAAVHGNICFFDIEMQNAIMARIQIENELRAGIEAGQMELYFQPQVRLDGRIIGAEGLIRWNHPVRGVLTPGTFIEIAESSGLIVPLGDWIIREACAVLSRWAATDASALSLSINISAAQLIDASFLERTLDALATSRISPELLRFEITESLFQDNLATTKSIMTKLQEIGISFAMDDFGTGFSSLSLLQSMQFDEVKIDQSFIRRLASSDTELGATQESASTLVQAIVAMGHSLGLAVVAEGVETSTQQMKLQDLHCDILQGYLFGKPMPEAEFLEGLGAKPRS